MSEAREGKGVRRIRLLVLIALLALGGIFLLRSCFAEWLENALYR